MRQTHTGICPTIGLRKGDVLRRHVATYCVAGTVYDDEHFFASAQRAARFGDRALLTGVADPRTVRWIEVESDDGGFLVRSSRSGAFFVAYRGSLPDGKQWKVRAALKGRRPIPFTAYRTVTLPPTRTGVAPPGAVFRRPRTAHDALPHRAGRPLFSEGDANPLLSRYLGSAHSVRFYAIPGERDLCVVSIGRSGGGAGCGRAVVNADPATPAGGYRTFRGGALFYGLLTDGIDRSSCDEGPPVSGPGTPGSEALSPGAP
ncbi:MAG TPA: hypothetical protein VNT03_17130 [Baekduia sp.]|nr:hypothetical protein [Baekduia sp.]